MYNKLAETFSINRKADNRYPMIVHRLTPAQDLQDSESSIVEEIWTLSSSSFGSRKRCCTPTRSTLYSLCAIFTPLALTGGYLYYTFNNFVHSTHFTINNTTEIPTFSPTISPLVNTTILPTSSPTMSPTASPTMSPTASPTFSPTTNTTSWYVELLGDENIPCVNGEAYHKMLFNVSDNLPLQSTIKIKELKIIDQENMIDPNHNIISDGNKNGTITTPIENDEFKMNKLNNSFTMFKCLSTSSQTLKLVIDKDGEDKVSSAVYKVGN